MQRIKEVITFFEEPRNTKIGGHGAKALYRFTSEYEDIRLRLKLEINCKEHFNVLPWVLLRPEIEYDQEAAFRWLKTNLLTIEL